MFLLTSCRIFAVGLFLFLFVGGCVKSDPASFPDLADFPKEPIIVPSPEAQKQQQAALRSAYNQGNLSLTSLDKPNVLVNTTTSVWLNQSESILQEILPILTSEPDIPVMIYISGTKLNHNNMLVLGGRIENDLARCGIDSSRLILVISFCEGQQEIQIQIAFASPRDNGPVEVIEEGEISDDIQDGS